jgi:hypothetical protein
VEAPVELTAYQRRVAALKAHRPHTLPAPFLGKVLKPQERVKMRAELVHGQTAADAVEALIRPNSKMDPGMTRRAIDVLFSKERPMTLPIADPCSPAALNQAMSAIHEAWITGRITPQEALTCQRLVESRYRAWLDAKAGAGLT